MKRVDYPNPGISALLSFVVNGLGQIYNGEIKKGLTLISISAFSLIIFIIGAILLFFFIKDNLTPVAFLIWGIILIFSGFVGIVVTGAYSISDAYRTAEKMNLEKKDESPAE